MLRHVGASTHPTGCQPRLKRHCLRMSTGLMRRSSLGSCPVRSVVSRFRGGSRMATGISFRVRDGHGRFPVRPWRMSQIPQAVRIDPGIERQRPRTAGVPPGTVGRGTCTERILPFAVGANHLAGAPGLHHVTPIDRAADTPQRGATVTIAALHVSWVGADVCRLLSSVLRYSLAAFRIVSVVGGTKDPTIRRPADRRRRKRRQDHQ